MLASLALFVVVPYVAASEGAVRRRFGGAWLAALSALAAITLTLPLELVGPIGDSIGLTVLITASAAAIAFVLRGRLGLSYLAAAGWAHLVVPPAGLVGIALGVRLGDRCPPETCLDAPAMFALFFLILTAPVFVLGLAELALSLVLWVGRHSSESLPEYGSPT